MASDKQLDAHEARLAEVRNDLRDVCKHDDWLLRDYAVRIARSKAAGIARSMSLRRTRTLSQDDLWDLTDSVDTSDIHMSGLISFCTADLVMEATNQEGDVHYAAVEASFITHERDVSRAIRNSRFLTRFTGRPAHAVVVGIWLDIGVQDILDSEGVFWHQLECRSTWTVE